jgi:antitoxin VapB
MRPDNNDSKIRRPEQNPGERNAWIQKRSRKALCVDLRTIADRAAAGIKRPYLDHAAFLYDKHGLPG